ncbi:hypothetical protein GQX73_g3505 [Xylaria multiplex]|uniref:TauD/TfdA-like domain-containing protein n=1 Tax=Xylaria multiplex TaxID=323545 RepID=A0A7C8MWD8_9PEZI|nr:hypothetical protein GQX73_g3505 [Xylaria multiplex]
MHKLPDNIQPSRWKVGENGLEVQWLHDSHLSFYNWDFLETYIKGERPEPENVPLKYFGAAGHPDSSIEYEEFGKNERQAVGRLTDMIRRNGFALVTGVPTETAATTEDLLEKITFIRRTHYGGFYDFIPDLALADAAYTNEPLPVHTDNTYFSDPAGIQAFHLLSHTDPSSGGGSETTLGGETLLVDGFYAAELLRKECPDSFNTLASFRFPCHASGNEGIAISPDMLYPVLELDLDQNTVHRIRWNPNDRGVIPLGEDTMKWYEAEKKYHEILRREELVYQFQLKPGTVLIFDNWRVLHGRTAFTGMRRICGGYLNRDDFISRWRNTNFGKREIFRQVIGE